MNKTTKIILGIVVLVIVIVLVAVFYKPAPKGTIKIGVILPLSGKAASIGEDMRYAIDLAAEEINKDKKIVEIIYEDEKCDPKEAVSAYQAVILKGVKLIIGAACSSSTLAIAPIAEKDRVVLLTPASAADKISEAGDYIFRDHIFASQRGNIMGEAIGEEFHTLATLYDQTNDGLIMVEKFLVEKFQDKKKVMPERQAFQKGATDFRTELTRIKAKNPEIIYIGALMPESGLIVKQMKELGISAKIAMDDASAMDKAFLEAVGKLSEGVIFSTSRFGKEDDPKFWDSYTERFGKNPIIYAAQSYDSLKILAKIIKENCPSGDSTCVKNELYNIQNYPGAAGITSFDENGDAIKPITIKIIKNGQFVPYEE